MGGTSTDHIQEIFEIDAARALRIYFFENLKQLVLIYLFSSFSFKTLNGSYYISEDVNSNVVIELIEHLLQTAELLWTETFE